MAHIQIEAHIHAASEAKATAGRQMSLAASIVVPIAPGFGAVPVAKNTLKVVDTGVVITPKVH